MSSDKKADIEAIRGWFESYISRMENNDFDSWVSLIAEDVILIRPNSQSIRGIEAVNELFQPLFTRLRYKFEIDELKIEVDSMLAYVMYELKERYWLKDGGKPIMENLKGLYILRHINGDWKLTRGIWNANPISE